jgi:proteasome lid subunit RPN8/RPN11
VYRIDGRDQLAAMRAAEARGEEVVGCWHSHTHTDAYPSPTDVAQAKWYPDWLYVVVSLKYEEPVLRAYRIVDDEVTEIPVELKRS